MSARRYPLQRGFSLVSAIFLLIVVAALGTFAVTVSGTQHQSAALDVLGTRAYHAARAGMEWGVYQVIRNPGGITCSVAGASNAITLPAGTTLAPFTVNLVCQSYAPVTEGSATLSAYRLTSTATMGTAGAPDRVERVIAVTLAK